MARGSRWTDEETVILQQMMAAGSGVPAMVEKLGRSKYSIKERWRYINWTEDKKERRRKQNNLNRHIWAQYGRSTSRAVSSRDAPEEVIADRKARIDAGPRDLAGAFFGDPPRGFSALDRKDPIYIDRRLAQSRPVPSLAGAR